MPPKQQMHRKGYFGNLELKGGGMQVELRASCYPNQRRRINVQANVKWGGGTRMQGVENGHSFVDIQELQRYCFFFFFLSFDFDGFQTYSDWCLSWNEFSPVCGVTDAKPHQAYSVQPCAGRAILIVWRWESVWVSMVRG